jgi:hypothetical protein
MMQIQLLLIRIYPSFLADDVASCQRPRGKRSFDLVLRQRISNEHSIQTNKQPQGQQG